MPKEKPAEPGRVWAYCRASTSKQETSVDIQMEAINAYLARHAIGPATGQFADPGVSGSTSISERPAGRELIACMRKGDHVVVAKLDRAFRSVADCAATLKVFERRGVNLHVVDFYGSAVDLTKPAGRMFMHMLSCFAEFEREMIRERCGEGIRRAISKGAVLGGSKPMGIKLVSYYSPVHGKKRCKLAVDEKEAATVKAVIEMWVAGMSCYAIAQAARYKLGLKNKVGGAMEPSVVERIVKRWRERNLPRINGGEIVPPICNGDPYEHRPDGWELRVGPQNPNGDAERSVQGRRSDRPRVRPDGDRHHGNLDAVVGSHRRHESEGAPSDALIRLSDLDQGGGDEAEEVV
jgi:putative DNA-invertase from lambdoid prophage Rac